MQMKIRNWQWVGLGLSLAITYLSGLFIPLMENDAAQHASMAMRMVLQDDFIHLYKGGAPYLDKPHLHFWLAALSMKTFGIYDWAYRLPSLLFLLLGAVSTFRLSRLLYADKQIALLSAFVFLSSQTIILSGHDVRTDAVLTGAVIFGIYHLIAFIKTANTTYHGVFAALGLAMSLASKGMVGVGIIGLSVLSYLLYARDWKRFFTWKLLLIFACFCIFIFPLLYAYYIQFDLNPDQVVRGETGVSGVRFILWDQSFKRFSGEDFGVSRPDYLFFFHSLLWLLIPFSIVFYHALFVRTKYFVVNRFKFDKNAEFLTVGGVWAVILLFSMSQFKLPHYMNSIVPLCAILVGSHIIKLIDNNAVKVLRIHLYVQYLLYVVGIALIVYLTTVAFGIVQPVGFAGVVLLFGVMAAILIGKHAVGVKLVLTSILFAAALNLFLNTNFYPPLTRYQAGLQVSDKIKKMGIDPKDIRMLDGYANWTLDFYTQTNIPRISEEELRQGDSCYLFVDADKLNELRQHGLSYDEVIQATQYRITMVKPKFLNAKTRAGELTKFMLVKINPQKP